MKMSFLYSGNNNSAGQPYLGSRRNAVPVAFNRVDLLGSRMDGRRESNFGRITDSLFQRRNVDNTSNSFGRFDSPRLNEGFDSGYDRNQRGVDRSHDNFNLGTGNRTSLMDTYNRDMGFRRGMDERNRPLGDRRSNFQQKQRLQEERRRRPQGERDQQRPRFLQEERVRRQTQNEPRQRTFQGKRPVPEKRGELSPKRRQPERRSGQMRGDSRRDVQRSRDDSRRMGNFNSPAPLTNDPEYLEFLQMKRMRAEEERRRSDNFTTNPQLLASSLINVVQAISQQNLAQAIGMNQRFGSEMGGRRRTPPRDTRNRFRRAPLEDRYKRPQFPKRKFGPPSGKTRARRPVREKSPLPEKLWFCYICEADTETEEKHVDHLETEDHKQTVEKNVKEFKEKVVEMQNKARAELTDSKRITAFCVSCFLPYKGLSTDHVDSSTHKEMLALLNNYCHHCKFISKIKPEYDEHKVSLAHIRNVRKAMQKSKTDDCECPEEYKEDVCVGEGLVSSGKSIYCDACQEHITGMTVLQHLKGKNHFDVVRKIVEEKRKEEDAAKEEMKKTIAEQLNKKEDEGGEESQEEEAMDEQEENIDAASGDEEIGEHEETELLGESEEEELQNIDEEDLENEDEVNGEEVVDEEVEED